MNILEKQPRMNANGEIPLGKSAVTRTSPELRGRIEKYLKDRETRKNPNEAKNP